VKINGKYFSMNPKTIINYIVKFYIVPTNAITYPYPPPPHLFALNPKENNQAPTMHKTKPSYWLHDFSISKLLFVITSSYFVGTSPSILFLLFPHSPSTFFFFGALVYLLLARFHHLGIQATLLKR
jgi:hypothetical protein